MDLRQLRYFVAIADEGSFTLAAQRLGVGQSAASAAVRRLEETLGAPLLDRTTHSTVLTDAGRALLPRARLLLEAADDARAAVESVAGGLSGTIRMGTVEFTNGLEVHAALIAYRARHPRVSIELTSIGDGATQLLYDVLDGRLDIAVAGLVGEPPAGVATTLLWESPMQLVVPRGHVLATATTPLQLDELHGETLIHYRTGGPDAAAALDRLGAAGLQIGYAVDWLPTALELVRDGAGVMLAAATATHWYRDDVATLQLADPAGVKLVIARPINRQLPVAARELHDTLLNAYQPSAASVLSAVV